MEIQLTYTNLQSTKFKLRNYPKHVLRLYRCDIIISRTREFYLYLKNRVAHDLSILIKYSVRDLGFDANTYNFMNETYHNSLFSYSGYPNGQLGCTLNFPTHGPHVRVWTHQSVCTPSRLLSGGASIL